MDGKRSRRVGVEKGTAISKSAQFGKGYKREIYDNAPWGGWLLVSAGGWERELGVRDRWGLGVVPNAIPFPPSPAHSPSRPLRPPRHLISADQPLAPAVVDTSGPCARQASRRRNPAPVMAAIAYVRVCSRALDSSQDSAPPRHR